MGSGRSLVPTGGEQPIAGTHRWGAAARRYPPVGEGPLWGAEPVERHGWWSQGGSVLTVPGRYEAFSESEGEGSRVLELAPRSGSEGRSVSLSTVGT